jgi:hypothetical protein
MICMMCLVCCVSASITAKAETLCSKETGRCFELALAPTEPAVVRKPYQGARIAAHILFWLGAAQLIGGGVAYAMADNETKDFDRKFGTDSNERLKDEPKYWAIPLVTGGIMTFAGMCVGIGYQTKISAWDGSPPDPPATQEYIRESKYNLSLIPPINGNPGFVGMSAKF